MSMDHFNRLELTCRDAANYPANGIRTRLFRHALQAYKGRLAERRDDLFESDSKYPVDFLEAYDGEEFKSWPCVSAAELRQHFGANRKDPRCRHVFIQADTSLSPLDCSKDAFLLLLSFHQVMPQFLDMVLSFGRQPTTPSDFHYAAFHHENFLSGEDATDIPRLGRSGRQIRQCYNLWGVEKSDANSSWSFRQTAVYHSFDIVKSRAFWVNIKANSLMLDRITDVETLPGRPKPGIDADICRAFAATLTTHQVLFQWCSEHWRPFLESLETEIHDILTKVKNAPIAEVEKTLAVDINALLEQPSSAPSSPRRVNTLPRTRNVVSRQSTGTGLVGTPRRVLSGLASTSEVSQALPAIPQSTPVSQFSQTSPSSADKFGVLKEFSVKSLQRLGGIGSKLQAAALIMKLDTEVLGRIAAHYESLMNDDDIPDQLKTGCKREISMFWELTEGCIRSLEVEQARIATLAMVLEDGKRLFDTILQFRNMEVNKLFTVNAHETAGRMEQMTVDMHQSTLRMEMLTGDMGRIAEKTERETASMHIITLVTLIFLPGTFVAVRYGLPRFGRLLTDKQTLFGSGLFQWDQNHPEMPFPMWKQEYFNLFAKICFPLTIGVIITCYAFYMWSKQRELRKKNDEEMQMRENDEKSGLAKI